MEDAQHDAESATEKSMPHDSMVTVRLSEPPTLTVNTAILDGHNEVAGNRQEDITQDEEEQEQEESPRITMMDPNGEVMSPTGSESAVSDDGESRRGSDSSEASEGGVNWEELEKTEEQEPRDQGSDDVSPLPSVSLADANCSVYGPVTSSTRTGKQPPSYESQIRTREGSNRAKEPDETTEYPTSEEARQRTYTACVEILDDSCASYDGSRVLRCVGTRLHTDCSMPANIALEEDQKWCAASPARCGLAEHVRCTG